MGEKEKSKIQLALETVRDVAKEAMKNREIVASKETINDRMDICFECEQYWRERNRCRKCGCFMDYKSKLKASKCPINKW